MFTVPFREKGLTNVLKQLLQLPRLFPGYGYALHTPNLTHMECALHALSLGTEKVSAFTPGSGSLPQPFYILLRNPPLPSDLIRRYRVGP